MPASCIELVQKYVGGTKLSPKLAKVGGTLWQRQKQAVEQAVAGILSAVRTEGDAALLRFTRQFDRWNPASAAELCVSLEGARAALGLTRPECMPEGVRAAERRLDDGGDVAGVEAVARRPLAVDADIEVGLADDVEDPEVGHALDLLHLGRHRKLAALAVRRGGLGSGAVGAGPSAPRDRRGASAVETRGPGRPTTVRRRP